MTPAVFLDRDGTLIESVHYLSRPEQVRLLPGVSRALLEWEQMGYLRIVITNQAALSKGLLSVAELEAVHRRLRSLLALSGASIDAIYYCSQPQIGSDRRIVEHWDRKPGPGLLLRAAQERGVVLSRSWMIGDRLSDTLAGRNAACKASVLVRDPSRKLDESPSDSVDFVVDDLPQAARLMRLHPH
jgi:D-glycero-D-manno-heptose 1,7-bisphosphate phosphatase